MEGAAEVAGSPSESSASREGRPLKGAAEVAGSPWMGSASREVVEGRPSRGAATRVEVVTGGAVACRGERRGAVTAGVATVGMDTRVDVGVGSGGLDVLRPPAATKAWTCLGGERRMAQGWPPAESAMGKYHKPLSMTRSSLTP